MSQTLDLQIFDSLLEPTFVIDSSGQIIYCNEAGALLSDLSPKKIIRSKMKYGELFQFSEPLTAYDDLQKVDGPSMYQELRFSANGKDGRAQVTIQRLDGDEPRWLIFMRDVTLEETLQKKYRRELEQKEGVISDLETARAKLEDYSKNLESMVAVRTQQISELNNRMQALLDSLAQGFFIIGPDYKCMNISSKACETVIERNPNGRLFIELLDLKEHEIEGVERWLLTCFEEMLPFEDLVELGPKTYPHSQGRTVELTYYPLRGAEGQMQGIVVVATDITDLVKAKQQAEADRAQAKMILSLVKNRKQIRTFLNETTSLIEEINRQRTKEHPDYDSIFRCLHTIKGSAGIFSIRNLIVPTHEAEGLLTEFARNGDEKLFHVAGQLCDRLPGILDDFKNETLKSIGFDQESHGESVEIPRSAISDFGQMIQRQAPELAQSYFEHFYLEPVEWSFANLKDNLQLVAERLGKQLNEVEIIGGDLRIYRPAYSQLFDSLIHAFRNSLDHGIETPEERVALNKKSGGSIQLAFRHLQEDGHLRIQIQDDGHGINVARLREKLAARGIDLSGHPDEEVIQHIFDPQLSTRDEVTELSGRGVGMDAIAFAVKSLGGTYVARSRPDLGTTIEIIVPWVTPTALLKAA